MGSGLMELLWGVEASRADATNIYEGAVTTPLLRRSTLLWVSYVAFK